MVDVSIPLLEVDAIKYPNVSKLYARTILVCFG